ncbi:uncharacterized protein [Symphalangus syndactylus]|uniref:uncharacterized protein isoform X1 n=1 Tax=Symphalangus syndactylus TaxID=9590 RepID=UPI0030063776
MNVVPSGELTTPDVFTLLVFQISRKRLCHSGIQVPSILWLFLLLDNQGSFTVCADTLRVAEKDKRGDQRKGRRSGWIPQITLQAGLKFLLKKTHLAVAELGDPEGSLQTYDSHNLPHK